MCPASSTLDDGPRKSLAARFLICVIALGALLLQVAPGGELHPRRCTKLQVGAGAALAYGDSATQAESTAEAKAKRVSHAPLHAIGTIGLDESQQGSASYGAPRSVLPALTGQSLQLRHVRIQV